MEEGMLFISDNLVQGIKVDYLNLRHPEVREKFGFTSDSGISDNERLEKISFTNCKFTYHHNTQIYQ